MRACIRQQKYAINTFSDIPIYYDHNEHIINSVNKSWTPTKLSINHIRQYFHNRCQNIAHINHKIQFPVRFIFPKIYSLARSQHVPSSADEKRLSSSRNSTALPPHSLPNVNFHTHATHRFTQHFTRSVPTSLYSISHILRQTGFGWVHAFLYPSASTR